MAKKINFTKLDDDYIINNYKDISYKNIALKLGYSKRQIEYRIKQLGLKKKREINHNYFNNIDTSIKAYFVGYIYADGWIQYDENRHNYELAMQLQVRDKYVLDRLNYELGDTSYLIYIPPKNSIIRGEVVKSGESYKLRIFSKQIVSDLMNHGICLNKSHCDIFPQIPKQFFFDFLRGYIDGDGCYWKSKNNTYLHITCASEKSLSKLKEILSTYNIATQIYKERDNKFRLMCTNINDMKLLVDYLYYSDDLFYLQRKFEKIKHYLGFAA